MLKKTPQGLAPIHQIILQIRCPFCDTVSTLSGVSFPANMAMFSERKLSEFVAGYACDHCNKAIPLVWEVQALDSRGLWVDLPQEVIRVRETFNFGHVPQSVIKDIEEALDCLSVKSYNGFAAMCRRAIQSTCQALGAEGSTKVERQINELSELASLDKNTVAALKEVMLGGHDGAHPQLPPVDAERANLLLQLLKDIIFQLFTRPGLIKEAATKRIDAVQKNM